MLRTNSMKTGPLTCFKAYDIRGELGVNFDVTIAYRIGRAVGQHFGAGTVVMGRDARKTSPELAESVARGVCDAGLSVLDLGMAGTEEMYWAVTEFNSVAGIEVTASHNPINYNGIKIVKSASRPLDDADDFQIIKHLAEVADWTEGPGVLDIKDISVEARTKYVRQVLSFIDLGTLRPLRVVINSGNGAAGPTFDAIARELGLHGSPIEFIRVHHEPDYTFPNGIPNPILPENHSATGDIVLREGADLGVAFDGDFDRCFFFDESGRFVPGEYVVGLLASIFLDRELGAKIVHDPRVVWNTQDIVSERAGIAVQSMTGHAFIKETMRSTGSVYGGEMSAHHYFRDFAYCDSGMVPWLLIVELISKSGFSLGDWVSDRFDRFPSSGEINFTVKDAVTTIARVNEAYKSKALSINDMDGLSFDFGSWRFNIRQSNTEPLVRLNIETRGNTSKLEQRISELRTIIVGRYRG